MNHSRHHHEGHHHDHFPVSSGAGNVNRAFTLDIALNALYVVVEAVCGFVYDSMGLLSDAGHNLTDVAAMLIALIAFKASQRKPTDHYTYGMSRATINASVANALILYMAVALILYESIRKIIHPVNVDGLAVAAVAAVGVIINGLTAWLFMHGSKADLNIRGVFLHMAADTLVSVGLVVSGIVIHFTGCNIIDPLMGIAIAVMIAAGSLSMLRDSLRLDFDGVPPGIDISRVRSAISAVPGVVSFHHLHIWPLSTTLTAMTVHVVVSEESDTDSVIDGVRRAMDALGIAHSTIEAETVNCHCPDLTK